MTGHAPDPVKTTYVAWMGSLDYPRALELQMEICDLKKRGFTEDALLLLEHPPTITLGRNGDWHNLTASESALRSRGVSRYEVDRGGDITFHGPGQLVGYPILQLEKSERDVHRYMRCLEESLIRLLSTYGIEGSRNEKHTGVWCGEGKIAAMGVHISRWITRHGFALNVDVDLSFYDFIIPCGIVGKGVVSMRSLLNRSFEVQEVARRYAAEFGPVFDRQLTWITQETLHETLQHYAHEIAVP